jgi:hypothetical protein
MTTDATMSTRPSAWPHDASSRSRNRSTTPSSEVSAPATSLRHTWPLRDMASTSAITTGCVPYSTAATPPDTSCSPTYTSR